MRRLSYIWKRLDLSIVFKVWRLLFIVVPSVVGKGEECVFCMKGFKNECNGVYLGKLYGMELKHLDLVGASGLEYSKLVWIRVIARGKNTCLKVI